MGQRNRDLERTGMVKGGEKKQGKGGAGGGGFLQRMIGSYRNLKTGSGVLQK